MHHLDRLLFAGRPFGGSLDRSARRTRGTRSSGSAISGGLPTLFARPLLSLALLLTRSFRAGFGGSDGTLDGSGTSLDRLFFFRGLFFGHRSKDFRFMMYDL